MDYEEYEEVESPYSAKPKTQAAPKERLRTRKNVFNRPFAAGSTVAPAVFETTSTTRSIGQPDISDIVHHRSSELAETEIDYLDDEEEEEIEKRPARTTPKKAVKTKKNILPNRLFYNAAGIWYQCQKRHHINQCWMIGKN